MNLLPFPELERALDWLGRKNPRVLDFGCGHGRVLLRSQKSGINEGVGLDISREAVNKGNRLIREFRLEKNFRFILGGIPELKKFADGFIQDLILFNVLDNLLPDHAKLLFNETRRLLSPQGKLLLKLNSYYKPDELRKIFKDSVRIEEDFFLEPNGLYFWNVSAEKIKALLKTGFKNVEELEICQGEKDSKNRLFTFEKL